MTRNIKEHQTLEKTEPWTKKELNSFTNQERAFIRDIQVSKKMKKNKAIDWYINDYNMKSKKQRRKLRNVIISDIESHYPQHKKKGLKIRTSHKLPTGKPIKKREFSSKYDNYDDWQESISNKNSLYYKRIVKAHKQYPEKSLKELRGHK